MLRRKMLAILLPTVAAVTLVGSGFSAWYFNQEVTGSVSGNVGVDITDAVGDIGTLAPTKGAANANAESTFNLILDQGGYENLDDFDAGISFVQVQGEENTTLGTGATFGATFTWGSADSSGRSQYQILTDAGYKVQITQTVRISTLLFGYDDTTESNNDKTKYLDVKTGAFSTWEEGDEFIKVVNEDFVQYEKTMVLTSAATVNYSIKIGTDSTSLVNDLFKYASKPQDKPQHTAMVNQILPAGGNPATNYISFSWTADVVAI